MGACCGKVSNEQSLESKTETTAAINPVKATGEEPIVEENTQGTLFAKAPVSSRVSTYVEYAKNKDFFAEKRREHDLALMKEFPIGYAWNGNKFQTTFWIPECQESMKHFIDIHNIPIYELGNINSFRDYCFERKWFHTMDKFWEMWESLQETTSRVVHASIIRYDINFDISDCFMSDRGDLMRAYKINGFSKENVLKAFSFITNTLRPENGMGVIWHHDILFAKEFYPPDVKLHNKYYPLKADCCGQRWDRLEFSPLMVTRSNCNTEQGDRPLLSSLSMDATKSVALSYYSRCLSKKRKLELIQTNNNNYDSKYFQKIFKKNIMKRPLSHNSTVYTPVNVLFHRQQATIIYFKNNLNDHTKEKMKSILVETLDFKIQMKNAEIECSEIDFEISQIKICLNHLLRLKFGDINFKDDNLARLDLILMAIPDLIKIDDKLNQLIYLHGCSGSVIKSMRKGNDTISYVAIKGFKDNIKKLQSVMKNVLVLNYTLEEQDILL